VVFEIINLLTNKYRYIGGINLCQYIGAASGTTKQIYFCFPKKLLFVKQSIWKSKEYFLGGKNIFGENVPLPP